MLLLATLEHPSCKKYPPTAFQIAFVLLPADILQLHSLLVVQALWENVESSREQRVWAEQQFQPALMRRFLLRWLQTASDTKQWLAGVRSARLVAKGFAAWRLYLQVSTSVALKCLRSSAVAWIIYFVA